MCYSPTEVPLAWDNVTASCETALGPGSVMAFKIDEVTQHVLNVNAREIVTDNVTDLWFGARNDGDGWVWDWGMVWFF